MAIETFPVGKFDPFNLYNGPYRLLAGPTRMGNATPDTPYGEFATHLYVGAQGDVSIVKWDGTTQVLVDLVPGIWHQMQSIMINSVGTDATGIVWGN